MNNINVQEIEKFVSEVEKDKTQAKKSKRIVGSWVFEEGKPQFTSTVEYSNGNIELISEAAPFVGGWGTSPDPIQYFLFGLASCIGAIFTSTATREGVELKKLEVSAEQYMDVRKLVGLSNENAVEKIKISVNAEGPSQDQLEKILALTKERCPIVECITLPVPMEIELNT